MTSSGVGLSRRASRFLALASAVALASGCSGTAANPEAGGTPRPTSAAPTTAAPQTLADLPRGSAEAPYALGRTLFLGDRQVELESKPVRILDSPHAVIVSDARFSLLRVDKRSFAVETITDEATGPPVLDPTGRHLAWQQVGQGHPEVVVVALGRSGARSIARRSFPATPTCCDNPFQVVGITTPGDLYAALPGQRRAWVWRVHHGQGPREIRGLRGGYVVDTTATEVVVSRGAAPLSVGDASDGSYRERVRIDASEAVSQHWVFSWLDGGKAQVAATDPGHGGASPSEVHPVELPLVAEPPHELPSLRWLDADAFMLDVTDRSGQRALARCEAPSGECEVVLELDRRALVPE